MGFTYWPPSTAADLVVTVNKVKSFAVIQTRAVFRALR